MRASSSVAALRAVRMIMPGGAERRANAMSLIDRRATIVAGGMLAVNASLGGCSMQAQTTKLFAPEDLDGAGRTRELAEGDLNALRAVAGWTKTFVASPNPELGRAGTVCPFVPVSLERRTLWLAPERSAGR